MSPHPSASSSEPALAESLPGPSMSEVALRALRDRLIFLDIAPGAPINETALSTELGVGRTPLREAIKRLETEHLVVSYPRRGTFASGVDITTLTEISQVREVLEPLAARLAAERRGGTERDHVQQLADSLGHSPLREVGGDEPLRLDRQVHRAISRAAGNRHLHTTVQRYGHLATRIWCVVAGRLGDLEKHVHVHEEMLRAILDGDADTAERLMRHHVQDFEHEIRRVL